jgi:hypothetical protein
MRTQSVSVSLHGSPGTSEYQTAEWFYDLISSEVSYADGGAVSIYTDVYFSGLEREQIDMLLLARFPAGLTRRVRLPYATEAVNVTFHDIIAVIEVKEHTRENVDLTGNNARVLYRDGWKSASSQNTAQIHSVKQFIRNQLKWTPYVCNLLLFPNLLKADFPSTPHNYLASDSSFQDFLEKLCITRKLAVSRSQPAAIPFSCMPTDSAIDTERRHEELQALLGTGPRRHFQPPTPTRTQWLPLLALLLRPRRSRTVAATRLVDIPVVGFSKLISVFLTFVVGLFVLFAIAAVVIRSTR